MTDDTSDTGNPFEEILELADAISAGRATDAQWQRLEDLVNGSDEACRVYVQHMHETTAIHRRARESGMLERMEQVASPFDRSTARQRPAAGARAGLLSSQRVESLQLLEPPSPSGVPSVGRLAPGIHPGRRLPARRTLRPVLAIALALAVAALGLVGGQKWWETQPPERVVAVVRPQPVAKVVRSVDARWRLDGQTASLKAGDWLLTGRYALDKGIAQIVFPWGTEVTLEAPTEIAFSPDGHRQLIAGQLVARVSVEDTGFTIDTPTVQVIDLGTEFGLSAGPTGESEVHVFKGAVEARQKLGDASSLGNPIRLSAGEATGFGIREAPVTPIVFNPKRFSRAWRVTSRVAETTGAARFVHPPPASVLEGKTESTEHMLLFLEAEGVRLHDATAVTMTQPSLYTSFGDRTAWLPPGIEVDSYLVHFDPVGSKPGQGAATVEGTFTFDRPILAIIARGDQLAESDKLFAFPGTQYGVSAEYIEFEGINKEFKSVNTLGYLANRLPAYSNRGLVGLWNREQRTNSPAPNDWVRLSVDRRTLTVKCSAGCEADQLRVLVAATDDETFSPEVWPAKSSLPFHGRPFAVGEEIQAEDYDLGGDGVGYYDATPDALANVYRISESVELLRFVLGEREHTAVCQARAGEWLAYTIEVEQPGWYVMRAQLASMSGGGVFRFEFGETVKTHPLQVPKFFAYAPDSFPADRYGQIVSPPIRLEAGLHTMRAVMEINNERGGVADFDWFRIERVVPQGTSTNAEEPAADADRRH